AERGWWQKPDPNGLPSKTTWKVMGRGTDQNGAKLTWLAMEPITGRTHQLRVHCSASGWPIVGDNIYGNGPRFGEPSLHLHAREIVIPLSKN
ncbi:pseudouridine synthase family protein, partial [Enterococcus faecium]|uniref:pseudouridine synthase family protein n=2 Tax=Bacteria TaxID=2 RepID=UPI003F524690